MSQKRVGILRGGAGKCYQSSLQKGGDIIAYLCENLADKYKPVDILIDTEGVWHLGGIPAQPADLKHKVDVVWNVADSSTLAVLESLSIPNVSNGSFFSALENDNEALRNHLKEIKVPMPRSIILPVYQKDFDGPRERYAIKKAKEIHENFSAPWIIKSLTPDKDMAMHMAKTFNELVDAIEDAVMHEKSILVEELIMGKVGSMHSVPQFRGEEVYTFPFGKFASSFSSEEKEKLINFSKDLHQHLGAKHYLKSNFVLSPSRGICLLGIESMPDLRTGSHFHEACESVGAKMHHVIEHILEQAR